MLVIGIILIIGGVISATVGVLQNTVLLNLTDINAGLGNVFGDIVLEETGEVITQSSVAAPGTVWIVIGAIAVVLGVALIVVSKKRRAR